MKKVRIVERDSGRIVERELRDSQASVALPAASSIYFAVPRLQVAAFERDGADLVIRFADGTSVRIEGYFDCEAQLRSEVLFVEPGTGEGWRADLEPQACDAAQEAVAESLSVSYAPVASEAASSIWLWPAYALASIGGIAAIVMNDGSDGRESVPPVDTTPPGPPTIKPSNGTSLSGTAEPGTTVSIDLDGDGEADLTVVADEDGQWQAPLDEPLPHGAVVSVTSVDPSGNTSTSTQTTIDSTPPFITIDTPIEGDDIVTQAEAADGLQVSGTTDAPDGQTVTVVLTNGAAAAVTAAGSAKGSFASGDSVTLTATASGGTWTVSLSPEQMAQLGQGTISISAYVSDQVGNSASTATQLIFDIDSPAATPLIASVEDDAGPTTGPVAHGDVTNDPSPLLSGMLDAPLEADEAVHVFDALTGESLGVAAVTDSSWTFQDPRTLVDGAAVQYVAQVIDAVGNVGTASNAYDVRIVITPPTQIATLTAITDDTGASSSDFVTSDTTLVVSGTLSATLGPDKILKVFDENGVHLGNATVSGLTWTYDDSSRTLAEGTHGYRLRVDDIAGNPGPQASQQVTVDTSAPSVTVTIAEITDDVGAVTGPVANGATTDDTRPTVSGTLSAALAAGEYVHVFDGATFLGAATVSGTSWTFADPRTLIHGQAVDYTARVVDAAGNESAPSAAHGFVVDTTAPTASATVTSVNDDVEPAAGAVANGGFTNDTSPRVLGTLSAALATGEAVHIYDGTNFLGQASVTGNLWDFQDPRVLTNGQVVNYTAQVVDAAGNSSGPSAAYTITADLTVPATTAAITSVHDDVEPSSGAVADGGPTNDISPLLAGTISGALAAGESVHIYDGAAFLGVATVTGADWTFQDPRTLSDGQVINYTARVIDAAGNAGTLSVAYTVIVDLSTPAQTVTISDVQDDADPGTGAIANGGTTNDTSPALAGTISAALAAGDAVHVYDGSSYLGVAAVSGTTWTFQDTRTLAGGQVVNYIAYVADAAGNLGPASATYTITIDTSAPVAPSVSFVEDDVGALVGPIPDGGTTDDTFPTMSGTGAEPDAVIRIYDNGTLLGTTTANAEGHWLFTPSSALAEGSHSWTAAGVDAAGNEGPLSAARNFIVDTTPPAAPTLADLTDDVGDVTGPIPDGATTDDTQPTLSGTGAEPDSSVHVFDNGTLIGVTTADAAGNWSFTPDPPVAEGSHSWTARVVDAAGNVSPASLPWNFIVDTTAPAAPTLAELTDDAGTVTGPISNGNTTDDTTPTLSGTGAEAGATVNVYDDGTLIGSTIADAGGNWSFTPTVPLLEGSHSWTAAVVDAAGNESAPTAAISFVVDVTAPSTTATITSVYDDVEPGTGSVANGGITNDASPRPQGTLSAALAADEEVHVYDGASFLGVATATGIIWQFNDDRTLADGQVANYIAYVVDTVGNASTPSPTYAVTVDLTAPTQTATIVDVQDDVAPVTGSVSNGGATNDTSPALSGTISAALGDGEEVHIYDGTTFVGVATVAATSWTYQETRTLVDEQAVSYRAYVVDASGNLGPVSNTYAITVDTSIPEAPAFDLTDDVGPVTGSISDGATTDDTQPTLSGSDADPNATISIYDGGVLLGTTIADAGGSWSFTPAPPLGEGSHSITVAVVDAAGNEGPQSAARTFVIDTTAPTTAVTITEVQDDVEPSAGTVSNGGSTNDTSLSLAGTLSAALAAGEELRIYDGATLLGVANVSGTTWTFADTRALTNGRVVSYTAQVVDAAGNAGATSSAYTVTVDLSAPMQTVAITAVQDDVDPTTGTVTNGDVTNDTSPALAGTISAALAAGEAVHIFDGTTFVGVATVTGTTWSFQDPRTLTDAQVVNYTARVVDAAGNAGPASMTYSVTIDTSAPTAPTSSALTDDVGTVTGAIADGARTDDTQPTLSGTGAEPHATLNIYDNGTLLGIATADAGGNWSFTPAAPLAEGNHSWTAAVVDAAGNEGAQSAPWTFVVDTTPPTAPTIDTVTDDAGPSQGSVAAGGVTDDTQPMLIGSGAEPNATLNIYDDGVLVGTAVADGTGGWSFTPTSPLVEGDHNFTVSTVDAAGNEGPQSSAFAITVNTQIPAGSVIIDSISTDTGASSSDFITSDNTLTVFGHLNEPLLPGEVAQISIDGAIWVDLAVTGTSWTYTDGRTLSDGTYEYQVRLVSASGIPGTVNSRAVVVDTTAPSPIAIDSISDDTGPSASDLTTADTSLTINGLLGVPLTTGETAQISVDGGVTWTDVAVSGTSWSYVDSRTLTDGGYDYHVRTIDQAGNANVGTTRTVTVDTTAPGAITIASIGEDTGASASDFITADTSLTISGTLGAPLAAGEVAQISIDGGASWTQLTVGGLSWSYIDGRTLTDGAYEYQVRVLDGAGNAGPVDTQIVTVDTTDPSAPVITQVTDNIEANTGSLSNGAFTNDASPFMIGTGALPNSVVNIYQHDGITEILVGSVIADASGNWSYVPSAPLADGPYTWTATTVDTAGNESPPSSGFSFNVDTQIPTSMSVTAMTDDTGLSTSDFITSDNTLTLSGVLGDVLDATQGEVAQISIDGGANWVSVDVTGTTWTFTDTRLPLADGVYYYDVIVRDDAGNVGASETRRVVIDTTLPGGISIDSIATDSGAAGDFVTSDTSLTLYGQLAVPLATGDNAETAQISLDGGLTWTDLAVTGTDWSYADARVHTDGDVTYQVRIVDLAGNAGTIASQVVTVDTTAPAAPSITAISDDTGTAGDFVTYDTSLTVSGGLSAALEAGDRVQVSVDGTNWLDANVSGTTWSFIDARALTDGSHVYRVRTLDTAGNVTDGGSQTVTVDTIAPTPIVSIDSITNDTGSSSSDFHTSDNEPTVHGHLSAALGAGERLELSLNGGISWSTWPGTDTNFAFTFGELPDGQYDVLFRVVDLAGNIGSIDLQTITIDTTAPVSAPTIDSVNDDVGSVQGPVASGGVTDDVLPGLSGTGAEANATVNIYDNGVLIGTTLADASGNWTFTPASDLADGSHSFTVSAVDRAGNESLQSSAWTIVVDTTTPAAPVVTSTGDDTGASTSDGVTNDNTLVFSGTAEANATIEVFLDGVSIGTTIADALGNWSFDHSGTTLADGDYDVTAQATDEAGNVSPISAPYTVTVDTGAPAAPAVTAITEDRGASTSDGLTSDDTLVFSGTAEANATVEVFLDGVSIGTTTADALGNWIFDHTGTTLADGTYDVTAQATDAAGNVSPASAPYTVTIDTTLSTPTIEAKSNDYDTYADFASASDTTVVTGTADPGASVEVFVDGVSIGTVTADTTGFWESPAIDTSTLSDGGAITVTASVTDIAGNVATATQTITKEAPTTPVMDLATLSASAGFVIRGHDGDDQFGCALATGDFNNDGIDDLVIGALGYDYGGTQAVNAGGVYVVFGKADGSWGLTTDGAGRQVLNTATLSSDDGLIIQGQHTTGGVVGDYNDRFGESVAIGDVNNDGIDDVLMAGYFGNTGGADAGTVFVVFGKDTAAGEDWSASQVTDSTGAGRTLIDGATLDPNDGFYVMGDSADDYLGTSLAVVGDVNGDGISDFLIGAALDGDNVAATDAGLSFLVFGRSDWAGLPVDGNGRAYLDTTTLSPGDGLYFSGGAANDMLGWSVSSAGDFNNDGINDLLVAAPYADGGGSGSGEVYVIFGQADGTWTNVVVDTGGVRGQLDLNNLSPEDGFVIQGEAAGDQLGSHENVPTITNSRTYEGLSAIGDINGDGIGDIVMGAPMADANGVADRGKAYVLYGKDTTGGASWGGMTTDAGGRQVLNLDNLPAADGFIVLGQAVAGNQTGISVSDAGDVNGDGLSDIIIGARNDDAGGTNAGAAYVIFGRAGGLFGELDASGRDVINLDDLRPNAGFKVLGDAADDWAGVNVSSAGDLNGDGYDDLVVGAPLGDDVGANSGEAYVIWGGADLGGIDQTGTAGADWMAGSDAGDTLSGAGGADTLVGHGGNDRLVVSDASFARVYGGEGIDTLALAGSGIALDFTAIDQERVKSIEKIDLGETGANTLTLTQQDVLDMSNTTDVLIVDGDLDDTLNAPGFTPTGAVETVGNQTYFVYTNGAATLWIESDIGTVINDAALAPTTIQGMSNEYASAGTFSTHSEDAVLSGLAEAGSSVEVFVNGASIGTVTADATGLWQSAPVDLSSFDVGETLTVMARATDAAGNAQSATQVITKEAITRAVLDLTTLAPDEGFIVRGDAAGDNAGLGVSGAGDVNGDGIADFIVGARLGDDGGVDAGEAYVIFGKADGGWGTTVGGRQVLDLTNLSPNDGFIIQGDTASDVLAYDVSAADVNGDGVADILVSAYAGDDGGVNAGEAYVVFGKADGSWGTTVGGRQVLDLTSLSPDDGFIVQGDVANDQLGLGISDAGDVNNDGIADFIVGARLGDDGGVDAGEAYVIFGKEGGGWGTTVGGRQVLDTTTLGPNDGFIIRGDVAGDQLGWTVSSAGDFNGDGIDDLLVAARNADSGGADAGDVYVVFGKDGGGWGVPVGGRQVLDLTTLAPADGFIIRGDAAGDVLGYETSAAGDINHDGIADIIVAAPLGDDGGADSGEAYVLYGRAGGGWGATVGGRQVLDLTNLSPADGFIVQGDAAADETGFGVAEAGDINGDGIADFIVGARSGDDGGAEAGEAYVIFGKEGGGWGSVDATGRQVLDLSALAPEDGFIIQGDSAGDRFGWETSSAGDVNHDGFDDIIVGAYLGDDGGADAGEAYIIYGRADFGGIAKAGTAGADWLAGSEKGDQLTGLGGADTLLGHDGNDLLVVADAGFARIDGGAGTDTLMAGGDGVHLDFTALASGVVTNVEKIDLGETGANTLTLTQQDVLDMSSTTDRLIVNGGPDDTVNAAGFTPTGAIEMVANKTYVVYTNGTATLWIESDIGTVVNDATLAPMTIQGMSNEYKSAGTFSTHSEGAVLSGMAEPGSTVELFVNGVSVATATSDATGLWQSAPLDLSSLSVGETLTVTARAMDAAGNAQSTTQVITKEAITRAVLDLTTLAPDEGFIVRGDAAGDNAGLGVSDAGDVNGDGIADFIVGARFGDDGGVDAGEAYVIFGRADGGWGTTVGGRQVLDLTSLSPNDGFIIQGDSAGDNLAYNTSFAGDINGDGLADLLVSGYLGDDGGSNAGEAYVVFGKAGGGWGTTVGGRQVLDLTTLSPDDGLIIQGDAAEDQFGLGLSDAGDVNNDGIADFIVAARVGDNGGVDAGEAYVIFGKAGGGWGTTVGGRQVLDMTTLAPADGFIIQGDAADDRLGWTVSSAGDLNNDGIDDLLVAARLGDDGGADAGEVYVVFGKDGGGWGTTVGGRQVLDTTTLAPADGFIIRGDAAGDDLGLDLSSAGDVNNDGIADIIIAARLGDDGGVDAGEAYVIYGRAGGGWGTTTDANGRSYLDLANLAPADGFIIQGDAAGDQAGLGVADAGDINGDGIADFIVGARTGDDGGVDAGEAYVIFGKEGGGWGSVDATGRTVLDLTNLAPEDGFIIQGDSAGDLFGWETSLAGDVNHDGFDDIIVGAFLGDDGGADAGEAYIIYGRADFGGIAKAGTVGADWLAGSEKGDQLTGLGGADTLLGHDGNDLLVVADAGFARIDGGAGTDTLMAGGDGVHLDFTALASGVVTNVEKIDLGETGANTLTLTQQDVLDMSSTTDTLIVNGGPDDTVNAAGFTSTGAIQTVANKTYVVYTNGMATLWIESDIGTVVNDATLAPMTIQGMSNEYASAGTFSTHSEGAMLSGMAEPGSTVEVFVNGASIGTVTTDATGLWQSAPLDLSSLSVGETLTVTARAMDAAGNAQSTTQVITKEAITRAMLDLTTLAPDEGFIVQGDAAGDSLGLGVSDAGDVNGDGIADFIVGALQGDDGGVDAGEAYVIFGKADDSWGTAIGGRQVLDLTSLSPDDGFIIQADAAGDLLGLEVSSAGDVNDDGLEDIIVGAYLGDDGGANAGEAYVIFGKAGGGWGTAVGGRQVLDLTTLAPTDGFIIQGDAADDQLGLGVSEAGDLNDDGIDDLIVAARLGDDGGASAGEAYVIFGKAGGGWGAAVGGRQVLDMTTLAPADGFIIQGDAASDMLGYSVASAGDVNLDGIDDLIIGAYAGDDGGLNAGEAYVIFGKAGGSWGTTVSGRQVLDLTTLAPADGFIIQGDAADDQFGLSVADAGDVNRDGIADLIVGGFLGDDGGADAGEAYVIFGRAGGGWGTAVGGRQVLDLTALSPEDGFIIQGDAAGDQAGLSISSAGDLNGDGNADLLVGARMGDDGGVDAGEAYVIFGKEGGGWGAVDATGRTVLDLTNLAPEDGFIIQGDVAGDQLGRNAAAAGDINRDGLDDIVIGARFGDDGGTDAGEAYVIFGRQDFGGVNKAGTAGADWLAGSAMGDQLTGLGGADTLLGHDGNDLLVVADADFARIDGGAGIDALLIDSAGISLDFTQIPQGSVTGVEKLDLTGSGANSATLRLSDLLALTPESSVDGQPGTAILIDGDADDAVDLARTASGADSGTWSVSGQQTIEGQIYDVYVNTAALDMRVLIDQEIANVALSVV